jgi:cysteine-S-conjugate beta-lyase
VEFKPSFTPAATHRLVEALDLFGIDTSWGGYESLAVPTTGFVTRTAGGGGFAGPIVRIHIGLEDVDDLTADLGKGLAALRAG